jgi:hypothetical protein
MKPFSRTHVKLQILKNLLTLENLFSHIRFHHMILKATMSPTNDFAKVGVPPRSFIKENYGVKNYGHGFDAIKRKERHDEDEDAQVCHSLHVSQNLITSKTIKKKAILDQISKHYNQNC